MEISGSDRGISNLTEIRAVPRSEGAMAVKACASRRVEPSAAMMSAAKMRMAETVAAVSMAATVTAAMAATMTSAMSAAAVAAAASGYRATRKRHRKDNERNSNQPAGHGCLLAPRGADTAAQRRRRENGKVPRPA
jgi:hypothetical protein